MGSRAPIACLKAVAAALLISSAAPAQIALTLEEAASRKGPDFTPAYAGRKVVVQGQVSTKPIHFIQYSQVAIQDSDHGLVLEGPPAKFEGLQPGQQIEVAGEISIRAGLPVLLPDAIRIRSSGAPPVPERVKPEQLQSFRYLGRMVITQGRVLEFVEVQAGAYLLMGDSKSPYKVFVPYPPGNTRLSFTGFAVGDTVEATGISSQYGTLPPYNRWFQLLVGHPNEIVRIHNGPFVSTMVLVGLLAVGLIASLIWWTRERRLRAQRELLRAAYELGEEILGASSAGDILHKLTAVLPKIFGISHVRIYLHHRGTKTLDEVQNGSEPEPSSVPLGSGNDGTQSGAAACFQNQTLLVIPDTSRSPFSTARAPGSPLAKSLLFVPMFAQGEVVGVFELGQNKRSRDFSPDEKALAQHLCNQVGVALKLSDQRSVREQLFRTEKLAAVGRLISGVVNELRAPLDSISKLTEFALSDHHLASFSRELHAISSEARRASEIVARLVSFAGAEQVEAKPVEVNRLLRNLIEFREREWKARGIRVRDLMTQEPLLVLGSQGQLEQVFLNLLVHAEQSLSEVSEKLIIVRTSLLARRILVEMTYTGPANAVDPFLKWSELAAGAVGTSVSRGIIVGHGGEIRLIQAPGADPRFEIELPCAPRQELLQQPAESARVASHQSTALVMEPDQAVRAQLLDFLTARGYRVVPVQNSDVGLDLAQRLRFDIVFCSFHVPGLNWVELSEQLQSRAGWFVLLSDGYDPELSADFEGEGRLVLPKPMELSQLERVLQAVAAAQPAEASGPLALP